MRRLRKGRVISFLFITFGLSWGFDLFIAVTIGQKAYLGLDVSPLGMFFPAFVAILLRVFIFRDSHIYYKYYHGKPGWILYSFVLLTLIYVVITIIGVLVPSWSIILRGGGNLLSTMWILFVFFVAGKSNQEELEQVGLQLGDTSRGFKFLLGVVAFFALQAGLNLLLGLGEIQGQLDWMYGIAIPKGMYPFALIVVFALALTGIPLGGLASVFGEEYGWRGFLQDELIKVGKRRGVAILGMIWGLWHFPVILSGVHTYPATITGLGLGLVFFILWGFIQSYVVMKTRSIWIAAFMHGLVNSVYSFMLAYVVRPDDMVLSFGLGVYGLACMVVIVLLILRDSMWIEDGRQKERST